MSCNNTHTPRRPATPGKWQIPMRPHHGTGPMEYYLEGELRELFVKNFPRHSNRRLMQWFGVSSVTLHRLARSLGLKKDMAAIRRELARDVKHICERNGYYASLRGRPLSEACTEAVRRKRAGGFHPMLQLKADNPRRYRRVLKQRSEARKEQVRKERLRMLYGLERKTRLRLPLAPLTHTAVSQKNAMIHKNNYFACPGHSSWVCYDSDTRRSPRREATAVRHGLKIVEGESAETLEKQFEYL